MKLKYIIVLCYCLVGMRLSAQESLSSNRPDCKLCHFCANPTEKNPCLKTCPRLDMMSSDHTAEEAPDVIYMDGLSDLYVPVVFSHKLHAQMADMSGGCQICHHHSSTEEVSACIECHSSSAKRADLRRPSLKGAYHRQCLGCHREWSYDTKCAVCHALKNTDQLSRMNTDSTDHMGIDHPIIPEPKKIVYKTSSEEGMLITFYHDEHIHLFGLKCVDCHQKENCQKCHDQIKPSLVSLTGEGKPLETHKEGSDHHKACNKCHSGQKCKFCHSQKERVPFNHFNRTGWNLNRYHAGLDCRACHKMIGCFAGLKKECANCHNNWTIESFTHSKTGLELDENHVEIECETCHIDSKFSGKPDCNECHDEDISFPENQPGKILEKRK